MEDDIAVYNFTRGPSSSSLCSALSGSSSSLCSSYCCRGGVRGSRGGVEGGREGGEEWRGASEASDWSIAWSLGRGGGECHAPTSRLGPINDGSLPTCWTVISCYQRVKKNNQLNKLLIS